MSETSSIEIPFGAVKVAVRSVSRGYVIFNVRVISVSFWRTYESGTVMVDEIDPAVLLIAWVVGFE
jgi:hypothetical protein